MIALDTNVLVYAHDHRDPRKQAIALQLIDTARPLALPWQIGCEFLAASRKLEALGMSRDKAWQFLESLQRAAEAILIPDVSIWSQCRSLEQKYVLSFWDALLVGACLKGGVQTLYSEDLGVPSRTIPGLALINPFV
jgi:predicted nucleic acid-binding protein